MGTEQFGYRRKVERLFCSLNGFCTPGESDYYHIRCENISVKGAMIFSPLPLDVNTYVDIELATKRMGHLAAAGRVCWCKKDPDGWRAGVAFDKELPFDLEKIL